MTSQVSLSVEKSLSPAFKQCRWDGTRLQETLKTAAYVLANIAIIGGLVAATVFFPHIMVPVWIGTGALLGFYGLIFALFYRYANKMS
jgi:hypothetical protein